VEESDVVSSASLDLSVLTAATTTQQIVVFLESGSAFLGPFEVAVTNLVVPGRVSTWIDQNDDDTGDVGADEPSHSAGDVPKRDINSPNP
jgi:hypothetical protein